MSFGEPMLEKARRGELINPQARTLSVLCACWELGTRWTLLLESRIRRRTSGQSPCPSH